MHRKFPILRYWNPAFPITGFHVSIFLKNENLCLEEYYPDAYEEIMKAHNAGKIEIRKYEDGSEKRHLRNEKLIPGFYIENGAYRFDTLHFCAPLQGLFHCLISHHICVNGNILVGSNLSQCLEFCNPLP